MVFKPILKDCPLNLIVRIPFLLFKWEVMQFRDVEWYSSQNIFILTPLDSRLITSKLYIIAATNKALQRYNGGYNDYPTLNSLKGLQITLPVTKDGNIDYQFMDMRVRELEEERVRELEAYLKAAGFEDCALNASECEVLSNLSGGGNSHQRIQDI